MLNSEKLSKVKRNTILIKTKNIDDNIYLQVQSLYKKTLDYYILNNTSIKKYDEEVYNNSFELLDDNKKDIYQLSSYMGLKYIYIRNFIFIEKLDDNSFNYIYSKVLNNNLEMDNTLLNIVKNTYKEVIKDNYKHNKYVENTNTCYGSFIPSNIVPADSLVFCIRYGNDDVELNEESIINYMNKKEWLKSLTKEIENTISNELGINVRVLIRNIVGE